MFGRKRFRLYLLIGIFLSLGLFSYKVIKEKLAATEGPKMTHLEDETPGAGLTVKDFHRVKIEDGRKVWEVAGEEVRYLKEAGQVEIKNPRFVFYTKQGEPMEGEGSEGQMVLNQNEIEHMRLTGGIEFKYSGFTFSTEEVIYQKDKEQVYSPGKIFLKGEGLQLEGIGMELALKDEKLKLLKRVKSKIEPAKLEKQKRKLNE